MEKGKSPFEKQHNDSKRKPAQKSVGPLPTRRQIIYGLIAVGIMAGAPHLPQGEEEGEGITKNERALSPEREMIDFEAYGMKGFYVGRGDSLFALYTQHEGVLPAKHTVSFPQALESLVKQKSKFINKLRLQGKTVPDFTRDIVSEYRSMDRQKSTLGETLATTEEIARGFLQSKDWEEIETSAKYGMLSNEARTELVNFISKISGTTLMAYSMTEIMASHDGTENAKMYDFLLRTAGKEFIARIPSIHDGIYSIGPTQMTRHANPDVESLRSFEDHMRATMKYCVQNLVDAIHHVQNWPTLTPSGKTLFENLEGAQLTAFLSAYHHRPKTAHALLHAWITDTEGKYTTMAEYAGSVPPPFTKDELLALKKLPKKDREAASRKRAVEVAASTRVAKYMKKTLSNYGALASGAFNGS